jgi:hypothetical protein
MSAFEQVLNLLFFCAEAYKTLHSYTIQRLYMQKYGEGGRA